MSNRANDLHAWAESLNTLFDQAWAILLRGVHEPRAPARHVTLSTVSREGRPRSRIVVLRGVNVQSAQLEIHTDIRSAKVDELRATPWTSVLAWDPSAQLQIRLECRVQLHSGSDARDTWAGISPSSRNSYGRTPPTGSRISEALDYRNDADADSFVVIRLEAMKMDVLHLGLMHRRAAFSRVDSWAGQWLVP